MYNDKYLGNFGLNALAYKPRKFVEGDKVFVNEGHREDMKAIGSSPIVPVGSEGVIASSGFPVPCTDCEEGVVVSYAVEFGHGQEFHFDGNNLTKIE